MTSAAKKPEVSDFGSLLARILLEPEQSPAEDSGLYEEGESFPEPSLFVGATGTFEPAPEFTDVSSEQVDMATRLQKIEEAVTHIRSKIDQITEADEAFQDRMKDLFEKIDDTEKRIDTRAQELTDLNREQSRYTAAFKRLADSLGVDTEAGK